MRTGAMPLVNLSLLNCVHTAKRLGSCILPFGLQSLPDWKAHQSAQDGWGAYGKRASQARKKGKHGQRWQAECLQKAG